jgi:hypothetical protein
MAVKRLDVAGEAKMAILDDATLLFQRIHALVEQYALAIKRSQPATQIMLNLKRQMPTLADKLRDEFGGIAEIVIAVNVKMTRGGSEQTRIRQMREGLATIKGQLENAVLHTIARHTMKDQNPAGTDGG